MIPNSQLLPLGNAYWRLRSLSVVFGLPWHGWSHRAERIGGLRHRLHSFFLSRKAGEHLALESHAITHLIARCHAWFQEHRLGFPDLYAPPAWAMGRLKWERLRSLPFRYYEVFGGVYDARADCPKKHTLRVKPRWLEYG